MKHEGSLPHSQMPTNRPYPESHPSSPYPTSHFMKIHFNIILPSRNGSYFFSAKNADFYLCICIIRADFMQKENVKWEMENKKIGKKICYDHVGRLKARYEVA
jgi:hypothetical protein